MEIENNKETTVRIPEIDNERKDFDFLGNSLAVGDPVILPYKASSEACSVLLTGKVSGFIYNNSKVRKVKIKVDLEDKNTEEVYRFSRDVIKIKMKPKEEKTCL